MLTDAFLAANDHWLLEVETEGDTFPTHMRMSDCVENMPVFSRLGDWVIESIEASSRPELAEARATIRRIRCRQLYHAILVPTSLTGDAAKLDCDEITAQLLAFASTDALVANLAAVEADIVVIFSVINYGSRDTKGRADNPVTKVSYFNPKVDPDYAYTLSDSKMPALFTPRAYEEKLMYVYSRTEASIDVVTEAYRHWRRQTRIASVSASATQQAGAAMPVSLTPMTNGMVCARCRCLST